MNHRTLTDRLLLAFAKAHCRRVLNRLLKAAKQATAVQDRVLIDKVRRNADSDYGQVYRFDLIRNYADFKRQIPLQSYEDIQPYIDRLRKGEYRALFGSGQQVRMFALTSGTAGKPKYVPVTDHFLKEFRAGWNAFGIKALMDHPGTFLKPILQITSRMDESFTEAGIPCGAITGLMASTQKHLVRKYYITPLCVAYIDDSFSRYYTIMRLALSVPEVAFSVTANPATQLRLAKTAAAHSVRLIRDIHEGTLWSGLDVPQGVRSLLAPRLKPDPKRAAELHRLADQYGQLLPKHYWNLGFLCNWTGGTLGLYLKEFPRYFGDTPVRDIGLIASEARMTIPIEDGTPAGILDVNSNFFEFIPAEQVDRQAPDCLRSHEVEVGQEYFVVLTNSAGFYRYAIGDKIRVVAFEGQAPLIEFLNRGAHTCSLAGEKLTEHQVVSAVNHVADRLSLSVKSYVLAPVWDDPPFYRLHVELNSPEPPRKLYEFAALVDSQLGELNFEYQSKQKSLRLGRLLVNVLSRGFLEARNQELSMRYRKNNEQYKHQFLLTQPGQDAEFPKVMFSDKEPRALACADQQLGGTPPGQEVRAG